MWKLLGELAVRYCEVAALAMAAGNDEMAQELIDKADACLVRRGKYKWTEEVEMTDVLRDR